MSKPTPITNSIFGTLGILLYLLAPPSASACGGFFCSLAPINQAGEQIVFKQKGNTITALVQIQYQGDSSEFAWVVPVPGTDPDNLNLSIGSELVFQPLEQATRPQFSLKSTGNECPLPEFEFANDRFASPVSSTDDGNKITIIQSGSVGPYEKKIIASDDPDALATWLAAEGFDLSDRGRELIAPYVAAGMYFVTLKLRQDQGTGDIQPIILQYTSTKPMIPIRLTAVAAQPNMGIIAWILGPARAVPLNFLQVTPNYTRLNWYAGSQNAYASYQTLITAAMDEAGGHGFATDYAGTDFSFIEQLPTTQQLTDALTEVANNANDAEVIAKLLNDAQFFNKSPFPSTKILESLGRTLPLNPGQSQNIYTNQPLLESNFDATILNTARTTLIEELEKLIKPLEASLAIFADNPYVSRLYTTLSAEEMTIDPIFDFNYDLPDQPRQREATRHSQCINQQNQWTLTLGKGTHREGEVVINAFTEPGASTIPIASQVDQVAVWLAETTTSEGLPEIITQNHFTTYQIGTAADDNTNHWLGSLGIPSLIVLLLLLLNRYINRKP